MTYAADESVAPMDGRANVDWAAILAGAAVATAAGLVLLAFGAALGLSVSSPYEGEGLSPVAFAVAAGLWLLWVHVLSFAAAGYVAARLRPRSVNLSEHEIDVRDGLHGLITWAVGVIAAALIAAASVSGAASAGRAAEDSSVSASVSQVIAGRVAEEAAEARAKDADAAAASPVERRAEIVRKLTIISAFITAASLLAGAVAAIVAAGVGGRHRDEDTVFSLLALRRPARPAATPRPGAGA
ncbi:MAG: hypothetical protein AB7M12_03855 [Hyphomonadaceae bacterium]